MTEVYYAAYGFCHWLSAHVMMSGCAPSNGRIVRIEIGFP
jgi:hypothetical protein